MGDMDEFLEMVRTTANALPVSIQEVVQTALLTVPTGNWHRFERAVLQHVPLPGQRQRVAALLRCWHENVPELTAHAVQLMLATASHCVAAGRDAITEELVWTGPSPGTSLRRTDQALLQVIRSARQSLLIVTFAAYKIPDVANALMEAIHRGVRFQFVAETKEHSNAKVAFNPLAALGPELAAHAEVFVWPLACRHKDAEGKHGSLHAKCAVADGGLLLLSSANLTDYAHNLNMEMGVLLHGGDLPRQVADHFENLIHNKTLVQITS